MIGKITRKEQVVATFSSHPHNTQLTSLLATMTPLLTSKSLFDNLFCNNLHTKIEIFDGVSHWQGKTAGHTVHNSAFPTTPPYEDLIVNNLVGSGFQYQESTTFLI